MVRRKDLNYLENECSLYFNFLNLFLYYYFSEAQCVTDNALFVASPSYVTFFIIFLADME